MSLIEILQNSIQKIGIKEVARRSGLSASTVSRINSGQMNPSLDVVEKISTAVGLLLKLEIDKHLLKAPRLEGALDILRSIRAELEALGVEHAIIFGSVARGQDQDHSDVDIYLDFGNKELSVSNLLEAHGLTITTFGENKIDVISRISSTPRGQRLKKRIDEDGIQAF